MTALLFVGTPVGDTGGGDFAFVNTDSTTDRSTTRMYGVVVSICTTSLSLCRVPLLTDMFEYRTVGWI